MMVDRRKKFEWDLDDLKFLNFKDAAGNPFDLEKRLKESKEKPTGKDVLPKPLKEEKEA